MSVEMERERKVNKEEAEESLSRSLIHEIW